MTAIIGTAGHIDHGKTALVRALTGHDTDRLAEEKERGISIDLGFAPLTSGNVVLGMVDVPGHERFLRNMLAGAHGLDLVLLVVAADDGVMPQTEEHLDLVHLLGIQRAVVAISKSDLVTPERIDEVREEVEILLVGTAFEQAPVIPVSTVTGTGVDAIRTALLEGVGHTSARNRDAPFRMPIDRAFVIQGHGTVATGTALAGTIRAGTTLRALPAGFDVRVRTVHVHDREVESAGAGERIALNLPSLDKTMLRRGDVLVSPKIAQTTRRFDAELEIRPSAGDAFETRTRVRLYSGTQEVLARVVLLGGVGALRARERGRAQIVTETDLVAFRNDRFVIRAENGERTIGGGRILHPLAPPHRARDLEVAEMLASLEESDDEGFAAHALLSIDPEVFRPFEWVALALGTTARRLAARVPESDLVPIPKGAAPEILTTSKKWQAWLATLEATLAKHHLEEPLAPGMEMEELRTRLPGAVATKLFRGITDTLVQQGRIARTGTHVHLPGHAPKGTAGDDATSAAIEHRLSEAGLTPPTIKELAAGLDLPLGKLKPLLAALVRSERIAKISEDLYYSPAIVAKIEQQVSSFIRENGPIAAADLRDMLGASRKFSIALEHFDRSGTTIRVGDRRTLRKG